MSWGTHDAESREARLEMIVLLLVSLASGRVSDARLSAIPPHERQEGTFDSLRAFLVGEGQRQPVVVVLDDLQWVDATSEALLHHLVRGIDGHRVLVIACGRPDYEPAWARQSATVSLALRPFDEDERRRMIEAHPRAANVAADLAAFAAERSEGNPFFLEELLKALTDGEAGAGAPSASVLPATVEDVITARIDRLDEPLKRLLQEASVIGRDFDFDLLRSVAGSGDEVRAQLLRLVELEFLREVSIFPSWTFTFKSSLAHEVAYRTLLLGRRRDLHARVARAIERRAAGRLDEWYELLAYHFARSADTEAAARYLLLAGDKAVGHFSMADARRYLDEAADKLRRLSSATAAQLGAELDRHRRRLVTAEADAGDV
jgi:predicted ATPase